MSRTFLCTTGTSIAQGCKALAEFQKRDSHWQEPTKELSEEIQARLASMDLASEAGRVRASAELNALHRMKVTKDDEVVLFVTDTADGHACGRAVQEVLREFFGLTRVVLERIEGLQVRNAERLRREGLVNLYRKLIHYLDDPQRRYGGGCVLCPNGGFKGIVPFMTILGMLYRSPVVYVFEFAETLITLPPLPIGFATDLFERALPAMHWAKEKGVFDPAEFYQRIPHYHQDERTWFEGFLEISEEEGNAALASLSPLTQGLLQREGGEEMKLLASATAIKEWKSLQGTEKKVVADHLRKLTSPFWRNQHRDTKYTNDLDFYPRGHNPWRFGGFTRDDMFHLCWFAKHDDYEQRLSLPSSQRAAFAPEEFTELTLEEAAVSEVNQVNDEDYFKSWGTLRAELDECRAEKRQKERELAKLEQRFAQAQEKIGDLQSALAIACRSEPQMADLDSSLENQTTAEPTESWVGRTVTACCREVQMGSYLLDFPGHAGNLSAILPRMSAPPMEVGDSVKVIITSTKDGMHYAKMAP